MRGKIVTKAVQHGAFLLAVRRYAIMARWGKAVRAVCRAAYGRVQQ